MHHSSFAHDGKARGVRKLDAAELRRRPALSDPILLCGLLGLDEGARPQGGGLWIRCPWHPDRRPSCSVTRGADGTVRCRCFACGATGDALSLVAVVFGRDPRAEFVHILADADELSRRAPHTEPASDLTKVRLLDTDFANVAGVLVEAALPLSGDEEAADYLRERCLLDEAVRDGWRSLPSDPDDLRGILDRVVGEVGCQAWLGSGLARPDGSLKWESHRLVIPWRDPAGRTYAVQRRLIGESPADEPRYIDNQAYVLPYGIDAARSVTSTATIMFVEGAADVLAARALCRRSGENCLPLGLPSASGWRSEWAFLASGREVVIGVDADDAGDRAVAPIAQALRAADAACVSRLRPWLGKDWADTWKETAR